MMSTGMPGPQSTTVTELSGWSVTSTGRCARQGLVDGVVDHLVDQVMQAPRAGRADVHARAQPDRLEALQDGDVLCGVGVAVMLIRKKPCKSSLLRAEQVYQNGGRTGPRARLAAAARATTSRSSSSSIAAASSLGLARVLGRGLTAVGARARRLGVAAPAAARGRSAPFGTRRRAPREPPWMSARAARARTPTPTTRVSTYSVPSRAMRAGQRSGRSPRRPRRPGARRSRPSPARGPEARRARGGPSLEPSISAPSPRLA